MSRRNARRRRTSSGKPAWVWFVLGNFVGGFVVFMIFMHSLKQEAEPAVSERRSPAAQSQEKQERPRFDFYKLLQESEVAVPPPKTAKPLRRSPPVEPVENTDRESAPRVADIKPEPKQVYILQAASFRDANEADRLRAQLMLANLDVRVETATDSRGTWHRVLVGPFSSRSRMAEAREVLADHKLTPLVLKRPAR